MQNKKMNRLTVGTLSLVGVLGSLASVYAVLKCLDKKEEEVNANFDNYDGTANSDDERLTYYDELVVLYGETVANDIFYKR